MNEAFRRAVDRKAITAAEDRSLFSAIQSLFLGLAEGEERKITIRLHLAPLLWLAQGVMHAIDRERLAVDWWGAVIQFLPRIAEYVGLTESAPSATGTCESGVPTLLAITSYIALAMQERHRHYTPSDGVLPDRPRLAAWAAGAVLECAVALMAAYRLCLECPGATIASLLHPDRSEHRFPCVHIGWRLDAAGGTMGLIDLMTGLPPAKAAEVPHGKVRAAKRRRSETVPRGRAMPGNDTASPAPVPPLSLMVNLPTAAAATGDPTDAGSMSEMFENVNAWINNIELAANAGSGAMIIATPRKDNEPDNAAGGIVTVRVERPSCHGIRKVSIAILGTKVGKDAHSLANNKAAQEDVPMIMKGMSTFHLHSADALMKKRLQVVEISYTLTGMWTWNASRKGEGDRTVISKAVVNDAGAPKQLVATLKYEQWGRRETEAFLTPVVADMMPDWESDDVLLL